MATSSARETLWGLHDEAVLTVVGYDTCVQRDGIGVLIDCVRNDGSRETLELWMRAGRMGTELACDILGVSEEDCARAAQAELPMCGNAGASEED